MPRSVKYVNRLKKLYSKAGFLTKFAKLPLIKRWVRKQTQNDLLLLSMEINSTISSIMAEGFERASVGESRRFSLFNAATMIGLSR